MINAFIELLKEKTARDVTLSHEADYLRIDIESKTGKVLSRQTVQRLTGALKDYKDNEIHLRGNSKEIIAEYLGYESWNKLETFLRKIAITGPENMYRKAAAASGEERIDLLLQAAEGESCEAMADLADCYLYGVDTEKNKAEGIKWLHKAADAGHTMSAADLGHEYCDGDGTMVDRNQTLGEKYLTIAAQNGVTEAQERLALLYYLHGKYSDALVWARKAAVENSPLGLWMIGKCFLEGLGVEQDETEGIKWMEGAAELGDSSAQWHIALAYYKGTVLPKNYTKMFEYLKKSAGQGNNMGTLLLGKCYLNGWATKRNMKLGKRLIHKSAAAGCKEAIEFIDSNPKELNNKL